LVQQLDAFAENNDGVALVLRIDSPGGSVSAAEEVWRAVLRVKQRKPVVVSMGSVAASGGYYIAAPAHMVFAEPSTVTGSIGIFALHLHGEKALEQWGVYPYTTRAGPHAGWESFVHPFDPHDEQRMRAHLEIYYNAFLDRVSMGRSLSKEKLIPLAEGRVWTGSQALENGLVDALGGLVDAVEEAVRRAGYARVQDVAVVFPYAPWSLQSLTQKLTSASVWDIKTVVSSLGSSVHAARPAAMAMALFPYEVQP
jgi:protease-4